MNSKYLLTFLAAGSLVAFSAQAAQSDGRSMAKRDARAQKVLEASRQIQQPRTMAQAESTHVRHPDGTAGVMVPTELWSTLETRDAGDGKLRVVETDGNQPASVNAEAATHE